ncbi:MAG: acyl-CoA thioester hydrolase, partial [Planctomycetota bacterium]
SETDQMGVVHHANYLLYLEEARTSWMRELGCPYHELEASGIGLPVRRADLRYLSPARYEDELVVRTTIVGMRGASVRFAYEVHELESSRAILTGEIELACVNLGQSPPRPRLLPDDLRARFEALVTPRVQS